MSLWNGLGPLRTYSNMAQSSQKVQNKFFVQSLDLRMEVNQEFALMCNLWIQLLVATCYTEMLPQWRHDGLAKPLYFLKDAAAHF